MHDNINKIAQLLNLTMYQSNRLKCNWERYDMTGLQKRGGVLYAPYVVNGLVGRIWAMVIGKRADLIGPDRILLRAQRGIKFCANGYHCVRVGRYVYYANACGQIISRDEFMDNK